MIVDLTMTISDHFRWPVKRSVRGDLTNGDLFQVTQMDWAVHGFTHIDAPRHILANGATTSDLDLNKVAGQAVVVDLSHVKANMPITPDLLAHRTSDIIEGAIILLRSNWDQSASYETPEFWTAAPYLTRETAEWLLSRKISSIGFDFPQDYPIRHLLTGYVAPIHEHVTHDVLLRNGVILIEYLQNLSQLKHPFTQLFALPLKIPDADGAPARVIAVEP